jgi:RNA polymerase sigma-70 factor (ECF subfamily)
MSRLRSHRLERIADRERHRLEAADENQERPVLQQADWTSLPDEQVLRAQLRAAVAAAIDDLPEIYRVPVVLRDIQGLTTEEASTRLRVKDQTLKSRLHRGRLMLRERLRSFSGGLTLHTPTPSYG